MKKIFLLAADFLGNKVGLASDEQEVVAYGLEVVFSNFLGLFLALSGGIIWGISAEILTAAFVWLLIRRWAGGAHCSTLWRCALASTMILLVLGMSARGLAAVLNQQALLVTLALCSIFTLIVTLAWAPAENPRKPISASRRRYLRHRAILVETVLFILLLSGGFLTTGTHASLLLAAALALATEGFTVTPAGYRVMGLIDISLGFLGKKLLPWKGGEKG